MQPLMQFHEAVVIDIETTGLSHESDRIIDVAAIRSDFSPLLKGAEGLEAKTYEVRVNPGIKIPIEASRIHGITDKDVEGKGGFEVIAQELRDFIGDRPVIFHNASFDKNFLNAEFKRAGVKTLYKNRGHCTMKWYQEQFYGINPRDYPKGESTLSSLAYQFLGVEHLSAHNAMEDAKITWEIAIQFYRHDNSLINLHDPSKRIRPNQNAGRFIDKPTSGKPKGKGCLNIIFQVLLFPVLVIAAIFIMKVPELFW